MRRFWLTHFYLFHLFIILFIAEIPLCIRKRVNFLLHPSIRTLRNLNINKLFFIKFFLMRPWSIAMSNRFWSLSTWNGHQFFNILLLLLTFFRSFITKLQINNWWFLNFNIFFIRIFTFVKHNFINFFFIIYVNSYLFQLII